MKGMSRTYLKDNVGNIFSYVQCKSMCEVSLALCGKIVMFKVIELHYFKDYVNSILGTLGS